MNRDLQLQDEIWVLGKKDQKVYLTFKYNDEQPICQDCKTVIDRTDKTDCFAWLDFKRCKGCIVYRVAKTRDRVCFGCNKRLDFEPKTTKKLRRKLRWDKLYHARWGRCEECAYPLARDEYKHREANGHYD